MITQIRMKLIQSTPPLFAVFDQDGCKIVENITNADEAIAFACGALTHLAATKVILFFRAGLPHEIDSDDFFAVVQIERPGMTDSFQVFSSGSNTPLRNARNLSGLLVGNHDHAHGLKICLTPNLVPYSQTSGTARMFELGECKARMH